MPASDGQESNPTPEAETGLQEVKARIEKISPGATTQQAYFELVSGVCALNRADAANGERRFRRALEMYQRGVRPDHVYFADARRRLASALEALGKDRRGARGGG